MSKTVFEYQLDPSQLMTQMARVDKKFDDTVTNAQQGAKRIGAGINNIPGLAPGTTPGGGVPFKPFNDGAKQASSTLTNLNWLISDSPYLFQNMRMGIMSISNNITPMINGFTRLRLTAGGLKNAIRALKMQLIGPAGLATAFTIVIAVVQVISIVMAKHKAKMEESTSANKDFEKSLKDIGKAVSIDALHSQIDDSLKLTQATDEVIKKKKEEIEQRKNGIADIKIEKKEWEQANDLYLKGLADRKKVLETRLLMAETDDERKTWQENIDKVQDAIDTRNNERIAIENKIKTQKKGIAAAETEIEGAINLKKNQKELQKEINKRVKILRDAGFESEKELRFAERLFELQTGRLPVEQQIAAWEKKKAEFIAEAKVGDEKTVGYKQKILDYNEHIAKSTVAQEKLQSEIAELQTKELEGDEKIAALKELQSGLNRSKLEDEKEYLTIQKEINKIENASAKARDEAQKKYEKLGIDTESKKYLQERIDAIQTQVDAETVGTERRKELETDLYNFKIDLWEKEKEELEELKQAEEQYTQNLAGLISNGGLEAVYEDMFSRLKQSLIQSALDRLGITRFMMNAEQMIITAGEQGIDGIRNLFHQKETTRQVEETTNAVVEAGSKGTASASGIPFPGNIAAIGIVLATIFSALRKTKTSGQQIIAAAQGAVISKPTLVLAGEALAQSGTEIVMPEKNFNRYMEEKIIPGIMAKVNVDNKGTESRLDKVEAAIYSIGKQIPGETGKAVKRAIRSTF